MASRAPITERNVREAFPNEIAPGQKKRKKFDYVIPNLTRMIEYAAGRKIEPRAIKKGISDYMGYAKQSGYNESFVDFKDQAGSEFKYAGISQKNLESYCRAFDIPFDLLHRFCIFDSSDEKDAKLSEKEFMDRLNSCSDSEERFFSFQHLIKEYDRGSGDIYSNDNLISLSKLSDSSIYIRIRHSDAIVGARGAAPVRVHDATKDALFKFGESFSIAVNVGSRDWYCVLMECRDDPFIKPEFVNVRGPRLDKTDQTGRLIVDGQMGPPEGCFRMAAFLFDPILNLTGWSNSEAGIALPAAIISQIINLLKNNANYALLLLSDPYEVIK